MQPEGSGPGEGPQSARLELLVFSGEEVRTLELPPSGTVSIGRVEWPIVKTVIGLLIPYGLTA